MPNIIINNYCNQKCSYCFAKDNMENKVLQKNISIKTYLLILKYLKINNDKNVRILGGEPLLYPGIKKLLQISNRGGFNTIIFSNLNIENSKILEIFSGIKNIRVNCNINNKDFYTNKEISRIEGNIYILQKLGINVILSYNIINVNKKPDLLIDFVKKCNIKNVNLKITNPVKGEKVIINNLDKNLGDYIYNFIKDYNEILNIEISCGLSKKVFSIKQLNYIKNKNIELKYGCNGNIGKFDVNTDGNIFKCFPFMKDYKGIHIKDLVEENIKYEKLTKVINNKIYFEDGCSSDLIS